MSDDTRDASVRLSADVDPYRRDVQQAAVETDKLSASVDRLSAKLEGLTKKAGKRLMLFGSAGAAGIATATKEAAAFEKQMATLNATAAISDKHMTGLSKNVGDLTKKFPIAREQAIELVTTLSKLGVNSSKQIGQISDAMVKLSAATGESLDGLTTGMTELGRAMGTLSAGTMAQFANSLLKVSNNAGVSASNVLSFAQAIAPAARAAQMSEAQVLGVATAFTKAGADGYAAANTFTTMLADITRQISTGSPEISKYSNLIGVTVDQFQRMDKADALIRLFDAINKQGPDAIKTLDRLGFDGVRNLRSIQALAQSGGLREAINTAVGSYDSTASLDKGSQAALGGLEDQLQRLRNSFQDLATMAGDPFLHAFTPVVKLFADLMHVIEPVAHELSGVASSMSGVATAGALLLGGTMLGAGKLGAIGTARYIYNSSPVKAIGAGFKAGQMQAAGAEGPVDNRYNRFWNRPVFLAAQGYGAAVGAGGGPGFFDKTVGRAIAAPFKLSATLLGAQADFYRDARIEGTDRRPGVLNSIGSGAGILKGSYRAIREDPGAFFAGFKEAKPGDVLQSKRARLAQSILDKGGTLPPATVSALRKELVGAAQATAAKIKVDGRALTAQEQLSAAVGATAKQLMRLYGQMALSGATVLPRAGMKIGRGLAGAALGMVGGGWGAALIGGIYGISKGIGVVRHDEALRHGDMDVQPIAKYNAALGIATDSVNSFSSALNTAIAQLPKVQNVQQAGHISSQVAALGNTPGRKLTNDFVKQYKSPKDMANYLLSLGITDPQQLELAQADLVQQYGQDKAQQASDIFMKRYNSGQGVDYVAQAKQTRGMQLRGMFAFQADSKARDIMNSSMNEVLGERAADAQKYNMGYADQKALNSGGAFIGAHLPGSKEFSQGHQGQRLSGKAEKDMSQAVGQFEHTFLNDEKLGFGSKQILAMKQDLGKNIDDPAAREKWFMNYVKHSKNKNIQARVKMWEKEGVDLSDVSAGQLQKLKMSSDSDYIQSIKATGQIGKSALASSTVNYAAERPQDDNANYRGMQALLRSATGLGKGFEAVDGQLEELKGAIKDTNDQIYKMADAAQQFNAQMRANSMHYEGRVGHVESASRAFFTAAAGSQSNPNYWKNVTAKSQDLEQEKQNYYDYMVSLVQATRNFGVQMQRAKADNDKAIYRSNRDFQLSMKQSDDDYHKSRLRSQRDFGISMKQQQADYLKSLKRQVEDASASIYDPFTIMQQNLTADAGTLLQNLQDQNAKIAEQTANLAKAKQAGLSQQSIDTMNLSDPQMAQQLNRLVGDFANDPSIVKKINQESAKREKNVTSLTQNPASKAFRRATEDFELGVKRANEANARSMDDMAKDFKTMTDRSVAAHKKGLSDMAIDYETANKRAKEDLANMSKDIFGDFGAVMGQAVDGIRSKLGPFGDDIIKELDKIKKNHPEFFMTQQDLLAFYTARDNGPPNRMRRNDSSGNDPSAPHAAGGIMLKEHRGIVAEAGPETIIPLDQRGINFLSGMYKEISKEVVKDMRTIPSTVTYKGGGGTTMISNSTNFNGPITVQAEDPDQMARALQHKARVKSLTHPVHRT